ncbi:BTAD domain-containing putative transcriptional regulator [Microtetraspora sp. NBRC 13810]|uniref:BTAD domain-containing putative transcriptional regulator n=1 Tax=Microtetraspora sp. NBRC 13810 TaxID=3030990 RepID=UPI00332CC3F4
MPLDLGGQRQRAVLARLLVAGGRAVPVNTLIDELWPGEPPAQALSTIQGYVSRLRRALEPDRAPREEAGVLVTAPPGYALRAETGQVDAWRFESLVRWEGARTEEDGDAAGWERMETALGLWRGPALAEFADLMWAATESGRLEELRLVALERRAAAGVALGGSASVVPDLEAHATAHPLREEAWRLLALALYRAGRQGDALGALRRARTLWRDELGLDLGTTLRRLEADMLAQAPYLEGPHTPPPTAPTRPTSAHGPTVPAATGRDGAPADAHGHGWPDGRAAGQYGGRGGNGPAGAYGDGPAAGGHGDGPAGAYGDGPAGGRAAGRHGAGGPGGGYGAGGAVVGRALRVVVVDDQALVRTGLRVMLDAQPGLETAGEAEDGEQAIAVVGRLRPDLVLMDIQMPRLDGLAAARRLLADPDPPKVIMMTTFGTDDNLYAALRAGVSGFVLKTSSPEQFVAALRAAAAGDALIDPAVTTRLIAAFAGRADPAAPPALAGLSDTRLDLLKLVARGLTNRQIAATLSVPEQTVTESVAELLDRLGLFDRAQLVVAAYESGLVNPAASRS